MWPLFLKKTNNKTAYVPVYVIVLWIKICRYKYFGTNLYQFHDPAGSVNNKGQEINFK